MQCKLILFIALLTLSSCTTRPQIRIVSPPTKEPVGRQGRYTKCLLELNLAGIRQDLLKVLCDSAHGEI